MPEKKTLTKVVKFEILKPEKWVKGTKDGDDCTWQELGKYLRNVQYISARIANQIVSDKYVEFQQKRSNSNAPFKARKVSEINKQVRNDLIEEGKFTEEELNSFSKTGALPYTTVDALVQGIVAPQIKGENWNEVLRSNAAVPSYKRNLPICIRCDKPHVHPRVFVDEDGDHKLDLLITTGSRIRIVLRTGRLDGSQKTILEKLTTKDSGWTQQTFQISFNERRKKWFLSIVFRFPPEDKRLDPELIVGADLGYSCPLFAAVSNSDKARIGRLEFQSITEQLRRLQSQTIARRRLVQRSGKDSFVKDTSRGGHGRKRRLKPIQRFEEKINNAYKTLNHQISRRLIDFAIQHNAGTIQLEDLSGITEILRGTFLGERWRFHELFEFIKYKAKEVGIKVKLVDPQFTSRRCYKCGHIHYEFTREYRDKNKPEGGGVCQFTCVNPDCDVENLDPDFNAAKNLATNNISQLIKKQCKKQKIEMKKKSKKT